MIQRIRKHLFPALLRFLAALLTIGAMKLILQPFQSYLELQIIELLYLLPITLSTVLWGLTPGIVASLAAFLVFNYFYIEPYNTLLVHQTQDVITLVIFLFVAVVLSQFIGKAREGMRLARSREWEATRMYELISALSGLKEAKSIARGLLDQTMNTFPCQRIEIEVQDDENDNYRFVVPEEDRETSVSSLRMPLETARGEEGSMFIWLDTPQLSAQEMRLLQAFVSQGALAFERVRLTKGENKVRILEESDQLKTSLLNSVSHELRTPLSVIKASVSSLRSGTIDWDINARNELLGTIEEETDQLNLLVGNLLDMSRIEAKALKPQRRWNAIDEIAIGVAAKMRKQLSNHHLEMTFAKDIPLVPTDYVMIGQVFLNLIGNCIKYAPEGSTIFIDANKEEDCLHVQVANQGPHVQDEHLERIFDKFYRVTEADKITGTGLGLSICKGIVEAHGGIIWANNATDRFVFHFRLPLTLDGLLPNIPEDMFDE